MLSLKKHLMSLTRFLNKVFSNVFYPDLRMEWSNLIQGTAWCDEKNGTKPYRRWTEQSEWKLVNWSIVWGYVLWVFFIFYSGFWHSHTFQIHFTARHHLCILTGKLSKYLTQTKMVLSAPRSWRGWPTCWGPCSPRRRWRISWQRLIW